MMDDFKGNAVMAARNKAETEADVQLLVECLRCQLDSPSSLKQALCTLATILSSCSEAKDHFRECGGIKFAVSLLTSEMPRSVKQAAMFSLGCAVERNTLNQKQLCQSSLFSLLYEYLTDKLSPSSFKQSANFFLLCLVSNNGTGQQLARKSNCIQALMQLFRNCSLEGASSDLETEGDLLDRVEPKQDTGLMNSISSALSACVNNPQNDENQRLCAVVFPHALRMLQNYTSPALLRPVLSFVGLAAANNVYNQQRLNKCGGLEVLVNALHRAMNNKDNTDEMHQLAVCITSTIDAVIADDAVNVTKVGDLGLVPLLLQLVQCPDFDPHEQLQVMVTLAHCTDSSAVNQEAVLENDGMRILIKKLAHSTDEEVSRAIKYVLHTCSNSSKAVREKETYKSHENRNTKTTSEKRVHQDDIARKLDELSAKLEQTTTLQQIQELLQSARPAVGKSSAAASATTWAKCEDPTLLKKQLEKEKSLREEFQHQVTMLRKTEGERKKKEAASVRRTQELMKELEKQQQQQQNTESQAYSEKEKLLEKKRQKEKEMEDIDKKLKSISEIVGDGTTCTKQILTKKNQTRNAKINNETFSPESNCSVYSYNSEGQKPVCDNPRCKSRSIQSAAVSQSRSSPPLGPKNFTTKQPSSVKKGHEVLTEDHSKKHDENMPDKECCRVIQGGDSVASSGKNLPARKSWPGTFVKPSVPVRKKIGSAVHRRGGGVHDQAAANGSARGSAYNYSRRVTPNIRRSKHQRSVSDSSVPAFDLNKYSSSAGSVPSSPALSVFDMKLCRVSLSRLDQPHGGMSDNRSSIRTAAGPHQEDREEMPEMMEDSPSVDESLSPQDNPEETQDKRIEPSHINSSGRSERSRTSRRRHGELCPGCQPPNALKKHILNSRTVNIALETNNFTCPAHRAIRDLERERIARIRQSMKSQPHQPTYLQKIGSASVTNQRDQSVYDFPSSSATDSSDPNDPKKVSPPVPASVASKRTRSVGSDTHSRTGRRRRVPFTPQEETNITHGVRHLGKFWTQILNTYDFHSTRTAVDLKDKFKRMSARSRSHSNLSASKGAGKPFSMCEERRLARGVRVHGHNWQFILQQYKFAPGRTAEELRNRWRAINTKSASKGHT